MGHVGAFDGRREVVLREHARVRDMAQSTVSGALKATGRSSNLVGSCDAHRLQALMAHRAKNQILLHQLQRRHVGSRLDGFPDDGLAGALSVMFFARILCEAA